MTTPILQLKNISASIENKEILKTINLQVNEGELHIIMGKNGSGKSTLASLVTGQPHVTKTKGEILYQGKEITEEPAERRARQGIFLSFQHPVEIPGLSTVQFLKTAINAKRQVNNEQPIDATDLLEKIEKIQALLNIEDHLLERPLNEGASGGEKKKIEMLQMLLLQPKLAILDEVDSGVDVDALKHVATAISKRQQGKQATVIITHQQGLLDYLSPTHVHIMDNGTIIKSGDTTLVKTIHEQGFESILNNNA